MSDTRSNIDKIKSIFFDYASSDKGKLEILESELDEIAKRIEVDVMGIQDDNEFANLKDIRFKMPEDISVPIMGTAEFVMMCEQHFGGKVIKKNLYE
mgnify:CR=1 FL=1